MMKFWWYRLLKDESGQVFPIVLVTLVIGCLVMVPSLNYVSTNLQAQIVLEKKIGALYAADAGIEDALWRIKYQPPDYDNDGTYSYTLADTGGTAEINGMSVDVLIEHTYVIAGEEIGETGPHEDYLVVEKDLVYDLDSDKYVYTLYLTNNSEGLIKIREIIIDFSPLLSYDIGSASGNITSDDPDPINGDPATGITLIWYFGASSNPTIESESTHTLIFLLSGPPDIPTSSFVVLDVARNDIGGISDAYPYTITATARDSNGVPQTTVRSEVWEASGDIVIRSWQVITESL